MNTTLPVSFIDSMKKKCRDKLPIQKGSYCFAHLLNEYISLSGMTKTDLSRKMGLTEANYILHIASGRTKPPNARRCAEIVRYLRLEPKDAKLLCLVAFFERNREDINDFNYTDTFIESIFQILENYGKDSHIHLKI